MFGKLNSFDAKKYTILSSIFFFIIGSYWIIRSLKNAIIKETVGVSSIPTAKKFSVLLVICLLVLYSKLISRVSKDKIFYFVCGSYFVVLLSIAFLLYNPGIIKNNILGFASYSIIESFGSVLVSLFWIFVGVGSNAGLSCARRGYILIFTLGQIGALCGTTLVKHTSFFGIPALVCMSAVGTLMIPILVRKYVLFAGKDAKKVTNIRSKQAGFLDGIKLILTKPYLLGILSIVGLYEIAVTIFDYQMQVLASKEYGTLAYASFNAFYGQLVTIIACIFVFIGTRFFVKKFGLRFCLMFFPSVVGCLILYFYLFRSLWVALGCMVIIKALSYGFNNPVKEMIYIPTSSSIKSRAKGWIEMFGNRSSKAGGATINGALSGLKDGFVSYGFMISIFVIGIWMLVAIILGAQFNKLVKSQEKVR